MADQDQISIKDLQLPHGVIAPNIWQEFKPQPALVSLDLTLNKGIGSAADKDVLDQNTVHYGQLAKVIRASFPSDLHLTPSINAIQDAVNSMARRQDGTFRLLESSIKITLPKASMHGNGVDIEQTITSNENGDAISHRAKFAVREIKVMTLIGVNSNERTAKQPLIIHLELDIDAPLHQWSDNTIPSLFGVEQQLVQIIEGTSFETLESLAVHLFAQVRPILERMSVCTGVQLRIAKPRAIPFADAPIIIVKRALKPNI